MKKYTFLSAFFIAFMYIRCFMQKNIANSAKIPKKALRYIKTAALTRLFFVF